MFTGRPIKVNSATESSPFEVSVASIFLGDQVRLALTLYLPVAPNFRPPVILIHGLLSSSETFDLPGAPQASLARHLAINGFTVVTYDQRGARQSQTTTWQFGLHELVTEDLVGVIAWTLDRFQAERVTLGCHSLGGLEAYALRVFLSGRDTPWNGVTEAHLGDVFVIASPSGFSPDLLPWRTILRRGGPFVDTIDENRDGTVSGDEYSAGLIQLTFPALGALLWPNAIACYRRFLAGHPSLGKLAALLPSPLHVYNRNDFDRSVFTLVMGSHILDKGSARLLLELKQAMETAGELAIHRGDRLIRLPNDLVGVNPFRVLTISSAGDRMVPEADVVAVHTVIKNGRHINVEAEFGIVSGHIGFLFKPVLFPRVYGAIDDFLNAGTD